MIPRIDIICPNCGKRVTTIQRENFNETVKNCQYCHVRIRFRVVNGHPQVSED